MYCIHCNGQIPDDSVFCTVCGKSQNAQAGASASRPAAPSPPPPPPAQRPGVEASARPLFVLRPQLITWVVVLPKIYHALGALFMLIIVSIVKAIFLGVVHNDPAAVHWLATFFTLFQTALVIAMVAGPIWTYVVTKRTYEETQYRFYADRVEYEEGYYNRQRKSIFYRDIVDLNMYQGVVQRRYGLGSLHLSTRGGSALGTRIQTVFGSSDNMSNQPVNGAILVNIPNPQRAFQQVQQLLRQAQQRHGG